jgi:pimeloyl-ACP methyl ester carboxylesterase
MMSIEHKTTKGANGETVSYRVSGPQDGLPTLLIHGWMMTGQVWEGFISLLGAGRRVIAPDLPGCGGSAGYDDGYTHAKLAGAVLACLDAEGVGEVAVVGHSFGGQLAQWIAANHPARVKALAVVNSVPASGMALPAEADGLFFNSGGSRELQGTILTLATRQLSPEERGRLLDIAGAIPVATLQQTYRLWSGASFADVLGQIEAVTLVVATDDPFLPPAFLEQAVVAPIKRARLVYLPGPGHYPANERPAETAALITAFLAGAQA